MSETGLQTVEYRGEEIEVRVAGGLQGNLLCGIGLSMCGQIADGVHLRFAWESTGGFIVSLEDLEKFCAAARKWREAHAERVSHAIEDCRSMLAKYARKS